MATPSTTTKATPSHGVPRKASPFVPPGDSYQGGVTIQLGRGSEAQNGVLRDEITRLIADHNRRLDASAATVIGKLKNPPHMAREWSADTLYDTEPQHSPKTEPKRYQASVSDSTDSDDEDWAPRQAKPNQAYKFPERDSASQRPSYTRSSATVPCSPVPIPQPASRPNTSVPSSPVPSPTVHFSDRNPITLHNRTSKSYYPHKDTPVSAQQPDPRSVVDKEEQQPPVSPIDAKWGILFNERGEPSRRMADVLRGLARYITAVFAPANSLIITPEKLLNFYSTFKLDKEAIELTRFFFSPARDAMRNLETLYLDLQCEYHLVQDHHTTGAKSRAYIPGLTPEGFVKWTLLLIRSFPDREAARLNAVVSALPLEAVAADGSTERLPRQISRRLLPEKQCDEALRLLTQGILYWNRARTEDIQKKQGSAHVFYRRSSRSDERREDRDRGRHGAVVVEVPNSRRRRDVDSPPLDRERSSRPSLAAPDDRSARHYYKSYRRDDSPRRSKRYERDGRDRGSSERSRRWTIDGSETGKSPIRRRESRSGR